MSRSVSIPMRRLSSATGIAPMSLRAIARAHSAMVSPGPQTHTSRVMASLTRMRLRHAALRAVHPGAPLQGASRALPAGLNIASHSLRRLPHQRGVTGRPLVLAQVAVAVGVHPPEHLLRRRVMLGGREHAVAVAIGIHAVEFGEGGPPLGSAART